MFSHQSAFSPTIGRSLVIESLQDLRLAMEAIESIDRGFVLTGNIRGGYDVVDFKPDWPAISLYSEIAVFTAHRRAVGHHTGLSSGEVCGATEDR